MGAEPEITYIGFVVGEGGDALQMLRLAGAAQAAGRSTRIMVADIDDTRSLATRCAELGVDCVRTPLIAAGAHAPRQRLRSMVRLLRSVRSPIVHFHTGNSLLPRATLAALLLLRYRRTFVTIQSPYENADAGSLRARIWSETVNRRMAKVISPSRHGARFQQTLGIDAAHITTIPNTFDASLAHGDGGAVRREFGLPAGAPLVVFTSRVSHQKRPVDAVRIFAEGARRHPDARLVFVGDGELRDATMAEVQRSEVGERTTFVGYRTDVQNWLAAATVWLLPTERENFSLAVLEAMSAGCAVLSTDAPGNDEILVDGVNALTFGVGEVADGAAALDRLLGDPTLRDRLGAQARSDVARYSVDEFRDRHLELYDATTGEGAAC